PDMVALLRRRYLRWVFEVGVLLLMAAAGAVVAGPLVPDYEDVLFAGAAAAGPLGLVLIALRSYRRWRYDPNAGDPGPRIRLGQSRAFRPEDAGRIAYDRQHRLSADRHADEGETRLGMVTYFCILGLLAAGLAAWLGTVGAGHLRHGHASRHW